MIEKILNFFLAILHHLGLYTKREYEEMQRVLNDEINFLRNKLGEERQRYLEQTTKLSNQATALAETLQERDRDINVLKTNYEQLYNEPLLQAEYLRSVQTQIAQVLEHDPGFGYKNEFVIPGSICVVSSPKDLGMKHTNVYARCVMDDATTKEINAAKTMYEKYVVVLNYILRFGALNRMVQSLVNNGAVQFTLAYREDTTTYECFFNVNAQNFTGDALVFEEESGEVLHTPDTMLEAAEEAKAEVAKRREELSSAGEGETGRA